jgi:peptidoglycan hydrolase-like protein with peptidoglycan-binding domain
VEYRILVPPPKRHRTARLVLATVVVLAAVAVGAVAFGRHTGARSGPSGTGAAATPVPAAKKTLTVLSTVPANGATGVSSDQVVTVTFSAPLEGTTGMPVFSPPVAGVWRMVGHSTLSFLPAAPFLPTATESLVIPPGAAGPIAASGGMLAEPVTLGFSVVQASTERLQQLLAQLNYLPLSFAPSAAPGPPARLVSAQTGSFAWRWSDLPPAFTSLWTEGSENAITKAAVMTFEEQHGLGVDGLVGVRVWGALLADAAAGKVNARPYTDVLVSKQLPETLTLFENGAPVMTGIAVNTGAPGADTADGTYPVFEHVVSSRMQGTNPDGSTYDDPSVPWASYFNGGDALHGFVRATYGSPQSNGCVEMPIAVAGQVWPLTPVGTPVTVVGPTS